VFSRNIVFWKLRIERYCDTLSPYPVSATGASLEPAHGMKANRSEIVTDFFSELKSSSSGFASFDYEEAGYETSDLVKVSYQIFGDEPDS
jgi:hypothetical protein